MSTATKDRKRRIANGKALLSLYALTEKLPAIERRLQSAITDCVADLLHYAHSRGDNPVDILRSAKSHFWAELAEELGDKPGLCVDCGTQCYHDGSLAVLCPVCDGPPIESGPGDNCAKCGTPLAGLGAVEDRSADGGLWRYCSSECREKH